MKKLLQSLTGLLCLLNPQMGLAQEARLIGQPEPLGTTGTLAIYSRPDATTNKTKDRSILYLHFHGAGATVAENFTEADLRGTLAVVNFKGLSSAYRKPFQSSDTLFEEVLAKISKTTGKRAEDPDPWQSILVSSFSAGYGAVREILKSPEHVARIDGLLLADSLYASLEPDTVPRRPLEAHMKDFVCFAKLAATDASDKAFVITHSAQSTPYASTTETADALLAALNLTRNPVNSDAKPTLKLTSQAARGGFLVLGYRGIEGEDHLEHLRQMHHAWRRLGNLLELEHRRAGDRQSK